MQNVEPYLDFIIVGGGPVGILCALECESAGLSYLILEKGCIANSIYHFPDQMKFYSTAQKLEIFNRPFYAADAQPRKQEALEYYRRLVLDHELNIHTHEEVIDIIKNDQHFNIKTSKKDYTSTAVIVATGYYDVPNKLGIAGEDLPKVSHYYKNPHPYIGKKLLIVGASNSACDAALECWLKGAEVTMVIRKSTINPRVKYWVKPNIENRIKEGSIQAHFNTEIVRIIENRVFLKSNKHTFEVENDFVLALTGYHPNYTFLEQIGVHIDETSDNRPVCNKSTLESNIPGLYLAGVIQCGLKTHELFIENTKDHGRKIIDDYLLKHSIV